MTHWLFKSEPGIFGIDDLAARGVEPWDGVRNYQARNLLRDRTAVGDPVFFYHSNCARPAIVGLAEVASSPRPDPTAFDPASPHHDPKGDPATPRWYLVDVRYRRHLARPITLAELKTHAEGALAGLALVHRGNRLSVMPLSPAQFDFILALEHRLAP
ncbi:EVE domain-containing protein [Marichromatium sp. AB31]|uniref:EVE domain-containing protein n=1 Tax=Marichromatium sp. AB31 TaxID=2483362 RepID=UPI000F40B046|nr:EVE domain-containing protein [Marichromatium sp. AB31]RNE88531.1 EVE domain-containing protein [Marichromatium sp. AB31]